MKAKKIISLLLILVMLVSTVTVVVLTQLPTASAASWSGMPDPDPITVPADATEVTYNNITYKVIRNASDLNTYANGGAYNCVLAADITLNANSPHTYDDDETNGILSRYHLKGGYIFEGNGYTIKDNAGSTMSLFGIWVGSSSKTNPTQIRNLLVTGTSVSDSVFAVNDNAYVSFYNVDIKCKSYAGSANSTTTSMNGTRNCIGAYDAYCNSHLTFEKCDLRPDDNIVGKDGVRYDTATTINAFGGFIGCMVGGSVTMTDCTVAGTVVNGDVTFGGFVGHVKGGTLTMNNCRSEFAEINDGGMRVAGFVGQVSGGTVNITNSTNSSKIAPVNSYTAGFIGDILNACNVTLSGCTNKGTINGVNGDRGYHGGFVGQAATGSGGSLTITNCKNEAAITITGTGGTRTGYVGGIVGDLSVYSGATCQISGCENTGAVSAAMRVGGIVGGSFANSGSPVISDCVNRGAVTATSTESGGDAGGIYGTCNATSTSFSLTIENCQNYGAIGGTLSYQAGGIAGHLQAVSTVTGCTNYGNVGQGKVSHAGGIAAHIAEKAQIINCTNDAQAVVSAQSGGYAGGILGWNNAASTADPAISGCINNAELSGSGNGSYVGGIVGTITKAFKIQGSTNNGAISGAGTASYTGGVVGYAQAEITISGSKNTGAVVCSGEKTPVGGIVGKTLAAAAISGCENTGAVSSTASKSVVGGIVGLSSGTGTTATLSGCVNRGEISSDTAGSQTTIAGIIGSAENKLNATDCVNHGTVRVGHYSGSPGGILGTLFTSELATLTRCTNNGEVDGYQFTGGIVGMLDNRLKEGTSDTAAYPAVKLDGCVNNGTIILRKHADLQVTATQTAQTICGAGGLIGELHGISRAEITGSLNTGLVTTDIKNTTAAFSLYSLGGFVGYCYCPESETAPTETWQTLSVTNSNNLGTVLSDDDYWQYSTSEDEINKIGNVGIGGFVGNIDVGPAAATMTGATLTTCRNYGHVEGPTHIGGFMGRVAWRSEFHIEDCANYGTVTGDSRVGGLVGYAPSYDKAFTVKDCFNMGLIYSTDNNAGGFLGEASAKLVTFENVLNAGTIRVGGGSIGGIAGYLHSNLLTATFTNCANIGKLINDSTNRTGGLVGGPYAPIMIDCYSYGEIYTNTSLSMGWIAFIDSTASAGVGSSNLQYYTGIMTGSKTTATDATGKDYSSVLTGVSLEAALETLQTNFGDLFGLEFMSERVGTANPQITVATPFLRATQKTASADGKFDIRLISTIDSLDYERVGFLVTTKYGTTTIEHRPASCSYVFVSDWQNGATLSARDDLCGEYMVILTYENVPASGTVTFTVTPYGFRDDTTYLGDTYDVVYTDGVLVSFTRTEGKTP